MTKRVKCPNCGGTGKTGGLTDPRSRAAVEVAERFADGLATDAERDRAEQDAHTAWQGSDNPAGAARYSCLENITHAVQRIIRAEMRDLPPPAAQAVLLREVFGNPFRPMRLRWQDGIAYEPGDDPLAPDTWQPCRWPAPTAVALARTIYEQRTWDELPILADALDEAGCTSADLLGHLRGQERCAERWRALSNLAMVVPHPGKCVCGNTGWRPLRGPHARGCWALDVLLGKE